VTRPSSTGGSPRHPPNVETHEGTAVNMNLLESELAGSRLRELQAEAEAASRGRRLYVARRAARRAERAIQRAARASAAVY
jgi:hypothetical protein